MLAVFTMLPFSIQQRRNVFSIGHVPPGYTTNYRPLGSGITVTGQGKWGAQKINPVFTGWFFMPECIIFEKIN